MKAKDPFVLFLTGAPGAGKSEVLTRVHDNLGAHGIDSAAIDIDDLARSYPPVDEDRHLAHVSALSTSFCEAGHELLLIAGTAESDVSLRAWLEAAGADRRYVVHLVAGPATLEDRVRKREAAEWFGLVELLDSAKRLAAVRFADTDLELDTETHGPEQVAATVVTEVRTRLGK